MITEPLLLSLHQVCQKLGLGKTSVYRLLRTGNFPKPVRLDALGRKNYFRASEIQNYVDGLQLNENFDVDKDASVTSKVKKAITSNPTYVTKTVPD